MTLGTYLWTWEAPGAAADDTFTLIVGAAPAAEPEPASLTLLGAGLTGLAPSSAVDAGCRSAQNVVLCGLAGTRDAG